MWAALKEAQIDSGLFLASEGTIEKLVARGDPVPGGGRLSFIGLTYSFDNQHKMVAFEAGIIDSGASAGIFLAENGAMSTVVRVGDPTPVGGRFTDLTSPEVGPDGTVVFAGDVQGGQATSGLFLAIPTGR